NTRETSGEPGENTMVTWRGSTPGGITVHRTANPPRYRRGGRITRTGTPVPASSATNRSRRAGLANQAGSRQGVRVIAQPAAVRASRHDQRGGPAEAERRGSHRLSLPEQSGHVGQRATVRVVDVLPEHAVQRGLHRLLVRVVLDGFGDRVGGLAQPGRDDF